MRFDPFRDIPGANEQAEFDVPLLRRSGQIRGSDERFRPVDHDAFYVQRAPVLPGRRDGSGIVVQPRQADAGPFVFDKVLCEAFDDSIIERSVGPFPPHVDAERSLERSVGIELATSSSNTVLPWCTTKPTARMRLRTLPNSRLITTPVSRAAAGTSGSLTTRSIKGSGCLPSADARRTSAMCAGDISFLAKLLRQVETGSTAAPGRCCRSARTPNGGAISPLPEFRRA